MKSSLYEVEGRVVPTGRGDPGHLPPSFGGFNGTMKDPDKARSLYEMSYESRQTNQVRFSQERIESVYEGRTR